jgi:hypothetical protein
VQRRFPRSPRRAPTTRRRDASSYPSKLDIGGSPRSHYQLITRAAVSPLNEDAPFQSKGNWKEPHYAESVFIRPHVGRSRCADEGCKVGLETTATRRSSMLPIV